MTVTTAADFLRGGSPTFARAFDRRGSLVCTIQRALDEGWTAFVARARVEAGKTIGANSLLVGGLPDGMPLPHFQAGETELPRGAVVLPDIPPHPSQIEALTRGAKFEAAGFLMLRNGDGGKEGFLRGGEVGRRGRNRCGVRSGRQSYSPLADGDPDPIVSRAPAFGSRAFACALVLAGVWPLAPPTIGIVDVKQFPLGTPLEEVADEVAQAVRENRAKAVVELDQQQRLRWHAGVPPTAAGGQSSGSCRDHWRAHARRPADADVDRDRRRAERRPAMDPLQVRTHRDDRRRDERQFAAHRTHWGLGGPAGGTLDNGAKRKGERLGVLFRATG